VEKVRIYKRIHLEIKWRTGEKFSLGVKHLNPWERGKRTAKEKILNAGLIGVLAWERQ